MNARYVVDLREIDETQVGLAGGKAANLGVLSRMAGVLVPDGFCVTTRAFPRKPIAGLLDELAGLEPADRAGIRTLSAAIRRTLEGVVIPHDVAAAIAGALDADAAYVVRSSATAEDMPAASFAGQQESYLGVTGPEAILRHVGRCWASLFTERAVTYRGRNGIDHRTVTMAVVVQRMVSPSSSGVMFTADPVTGNRRITTVEAVPGLGDELVSGLADPDTYRVRDGAVLTEPQPGPALTAAQVVRLAGLGRRIEAHFGRPQDIEWCLAGDDFWIVQSRPITTLFPLPPVADQERHIYLSVGHQQMMTDAMKPLGYSMWQLTALAPMLEAGGRLFVDSTRHVAAPGFLSMVGRTDPLTRDALESVLPRTEPEAAPPAAPATVVPGPAVVTELIERSRASIEALRRDIRAHTGPALFDFLLEAFEEHKRVLKDPRSFQAIMAGMEATWWLNDRLLEWLGEKNAADVLSLSAPGNITAEMGLDLLGVADVIRPHPEVVAFLQAGGEPWDDLAKVPGGAEARDAIEGYLDRYGMRCVGEIDITRPRWSERPATLFPALLDNVRHFPPGAAKQRFEQGRQRAEEKAHDILVRLRALPDGARKADEAARMIDRVRAFTGYREYPKYDIISRYFIYKQALLSEIERLFADPEDAFHLTFHELHHAVREKAVDLDLIRDRQETHRANQRLTPPRVLTSDGEALTGSYRRDDVPPGALIGLPVSAGTVEGRARVVRDMSEAELQPGDILVTAHTDPSWTPLFVTVAGLVTEVGGQMTHGAVIAREYGLPAVVSVLDATRLIPDGHRIRVHGGDGYVELLP